jgi:cytochrome c peroxidase
MGTLAWVGCKEKLQTEVQYKDPTPYSLSVPGYFSTRSDTSEVPLTVEGIALGKMLFTDATLSADGKVSCQSCHQPDAAFSDPRRVSLGVQNQPGTRNSMALVNLAYTSHFFWDGRQRSLEEMLVEPMTRTDEMGLSPGAIETKLSQGAYPDAFAKAFKAQKPTFLLARRALGMFVRSLVSTRSNYDLYLQGQYDPTPAERRGLTLFFTHPDPRAMLRGGNCGDCHQTITTAGSTIGLTGFKNNGLSINSLNDYGLELFTGNASDKGKFKIPSLRNIALTAPYMHDGRLATLEQVLDHYNAPDLYSQPNADILLINGINQRGGTSLGLTALEKADIIAFLNMLTDSTYLNP